MDTVAALEELGGCATRAALREKKVRWRDLKTAVDEQRVRRIRRGVYVLGLADGIDTLRAAAVSLRAVVSHDSAAVLWGLEMIHQPGQHVTVGRNRSRTRYEGIEVHRTDPGETEVRDGMRVTGVLRTVLDCAASLPLADAVVIADSALRAGLVTPDELRTGARKVCGRHGPAARRVAELADDSAGSVLESLLRVLLVVAGMAPDATQVVVRDELGRFVARVDFMYLRARLIIEADGFEFHRERADYRKDRRRANAYCRGDWSVLRFTWEDVRFDPDYVLDAVRVELAKEPRVFRPVPVQTHTHSAA